MEPAVGRASAESIQEMVGTLREFFSWVGSDSILSPFCFLALRIFSFVLTRVVFVVGVEQPVAFIMSGREALESEN